MINESLIVKAGSEVFTIPPKGVHSKADAGYVAKGPFSCKHCDWYEGGSAATGGCAVIGSDISRNGCCDYWNDQDAPKGIGKKGAEYVYVPGANYTCAECTYFNGTDGCSPVRGTISPRGSCNFWTPHSTLAKGHPSPMDHYAALAKADPAGRVVRHQDHTGFLHSNGQLECLDKAGNPNHGADGKFSSANAVKATRAAAASPGDRDSNENAITQHARMERAGANGSGMRVQHELAAYHSQAVNAHEASAVANLTSHHKLPGADVNHSVAARAHMDAANMLEHRLDHMRTPAEKDVVHTMYPAIAAHRKLAAFHSQQIGTSTGGKSFNPGDKVHVVDEHGVSRPGTYLRSNERNAVGTHLVDIPSMGGKTSVPEHMLHNLGESTLPRSGKSFADNFQKKDFSDDVRDKLADKGEAESDGSFPIRNATDLHHAISDWGRAGSKASDKAWIIRRAHALGCTDQLPADWVSKAGACDCLCHANGQKEHCAACNMAKAANSWQEDGPVNTQAMPASGEAAEDEPAITTTGSTSGSYANWLNRGGRTKPTPAFQKKQTSTTRTPR